MNDCFWCSMVSDMGECEVDHAYVSMNTNEGYELSEEWDIISREALKPWVEYFYKVHRLMYGEEKDNE